MQETAKIIVQGKGESCTWKVNTQRSKEPHRSMLPVLKNKAFLHGASPALQDSARRRRKPYLESEVSNWQKNTWRSKEHPTFEFIQTLDSSSNNAIYSHLSHNPRLRYKNSQYILMWMTGIGSILWYGIVDRTLSEAPVAKNFRPLPSRSQ